MDGFKALLEKSGVGLCVTGKDGVVLLQNEACAKVCSPSVGSACEKGPVILCRYRGNGDERTVRVPIQSVNGEFFDVIGI